MRICAPTCCSPPISAARGSATRPRSPTHRGRRLLWAQQGPFALALAAICDGQRDAFGRASAGYVGASDGWQDFYRNCAMTWEYASAGPGNVALMGELPRASLLALAFGSSPESAATLALTALFEPFERTRDRHRRRLGGVESPNQRAPPECLDGLPPVCTEQFHVSSMVLRAHQDKTYPGAMVASLIGALGQHQGGARGLPPGVAARSGGMRRCAARGRRDARGGQYAAISAARRSSPTDTGTRTSTSAASPYWTGVQLDETALPVLLADLLAERDALEGTEVADMIRRALSYIVRHGPASDQDRWEESAGLNTFTLAACIAALVAGAEHLEAGCARARAGRRRLLEFAARGLDRRAAIRRSRAASSIPGYYVRVAPPQAIADRGAFDRVQPIRNQAMDPGLPAAAQFGVDFLQLVRFGLRRFDDPLIVGSLRLADALLKSRHAERPVLAPLFR